MKDKDKRAIIFYLHENMASPYLQNVLSLLEILIHEARVSNDTADGAAVINNQGIIQGYQRLKDYIVKPLP